MKQAILMHGTGGSGTDYFWFSDTKKFLENNGYSVWWKELPNTKRPTIEETYNFMKTEFPALTKETIIIGHSSACPVILHWLENQEIVVKQSVLVGGFYKPFGKEKRGGIMLPDSFDWSDIRSKAKEIIMINSDNDPWGCTDELAREAALKLNAKLIVNSGEGHMGSTSHNQPYPDLPILKRLIAK